MVAPVVTTGDLISAADWNSGSLGLVGYATKTSSQTGLQDATITALTLTSISLKAGRVYVARAHGLIQYSDASDYFVGRVLVDGVVQGLWHAYSDSIAAQFVLGEGGVPFTVGSDGTYTVAFKLVRISGTGTVDFEASSTNVGWSMVEDVGPV